MFQYIKEKLYRVKVWYRRVFLYPVDTLTVQDSQDYDEYWRDKLGSGRVKGLTAYEQARTDIVLDHIDKDEQGTIADIASGPGYLLEHILTKRSHMSGVAYDISQYALAEAKKLGLDTVEMDIGNKDDLNKLQSADYFLLLEILEHIPHSELMLERTVSLAKKGVFFSFPNTGFLSYRLRMLFGRTPLQWRHFPNEHLRFWTIKDLCFWLNALGYTNYKIVPYKGFPILNRLLPNLCAASVVVYLPKR